MIPLRHMLRAFTRPYYIAVAQTIGDYVYKLIPALEKSETNPDGVRRILMMFDAMLESFARNSDRPTLKIAVEHWATRVASPISVRTVSALFSDPEWFQRVFIDLRIHFPRRGASGGSGLAMFQLALKDAGIISAPTFLEERQQLGLEPLAPSD